MKRILKNIGIASALIVLVGACKEDTLLFPPAVEQSGNDGVIDVVAKPSDVVILGEYDYKFRIKWPALSEKVAKIVVAYTDGGEAKIAEFTDFSQDGLIETSAFGEYDFALTTYGLDGQVSKPVSITANNKGFIIEEVIESPLINLLEGEVEVSFTNNNLVPITVTVTYPGTDGNLTKTITSSEEVIVISFPAQDGTHEYSIELEDEQGRKVSDSYSYEFEYIITSSFYAGYGTGRVAFTNNANSNITLKVTYPVSGGGTTTVEESFDSNNAVFNFDPIDGTHQVFVEYIDAGGRSSEKTFSYTHYPFVHKTYITAAEKAGFSISVSSNQDNDGGGAPALIDGNASTFWHSPWSGTIPPWPHFATINFNKEIQITKLILQLRSNGAAAPKTIDLQVSTDGTNFVTHQTFTNSSVVGGTILDYPLTVPVATRYARVSFRDGFNTQHTNLAEISFEGNENL